MSYDCGVFISYVDNSKNENFSSNEPSHAVTSVSKHNKKSLRIGAKGHNSDNVESERKNIISFVERFTDIEDAKKKELVTDIDKLPGDELSGLYKRIKNNIIVASKLSWENKLHNYINGNPPPPKYATDKGGRTPSEFLEDVWGKFLDNDVLYQNALADYDDKLIPALHRYWQLHGRQPTDRLPLPIRERTNTILQQAADCGPYALEEIRRAANSSDRRASRARAR